MSSKVPQIDSDSEAVAPDYPTYTTSSGNIVRVASPSELGLRQIQTLMKLARRIQPIMSLMAEADDDEELSDEEFDTALHAAQAFVKITSEMDEDELEEMGELEYVSYVTGFLQELTSSINVSQNLRFR